MTLRLRLRAKDAESNSPVELNPKTQKSRQDKMTHNKTTRVRLSIDFPDVESMMEWFQAHRYRGAFGVKPHPEVIAAEIPRMDVGVRQTDALDHRKVPASRHFIVAGTKDGGKWVTLKDETTTSFTLEAR